MFNRNEDERLIPNPLFFNTQNETGAQQNPQNSQNPVRSFTIPTFSSSANFQAQTTQQPQYEYRVYHTALPQQDIHNYQKQLQEMEIQTKFRVEQLRKHQEQIQKQQEQELQRQRQQQELQKQQHLQKQKNIQFLIDGNQDNENHLNEDEYGFGLLANESGLNFLGNNNNNVLFTAADDDDNRIHFLDDINIFIVEEQSEPEKEEEHQQQVQHQEVLEQVAVEEVREEVQTNSSIDTNRKRHRDNKDNRDSSFTKSKRIRTQAESTKQIALIEKEITKIKMKTEKRKTKIFRHQEKIVKANAEANSYKETNTLSIKKDAKNFEHEAEEIIKQAVELDTLAIADELATENINIDIDELNKSIEAAKQEKLNFIKNLEIEKQKMQLLSEIFLSKHKQKQERLAEEKIKLENETLEFNQSLSKLTLDEKEFSKSLTQEKDSKNLISQNIEEEIRKEHEITSEIENEKLRLETLNKEIEKKKLETEKFIKLKLVAEAKKKLAMIKLEKQKLEQEKRKKIEELKKLKEINKQNEEPALEIDFTNDAVSINQFSVFAQQNKEQDEVQTANSTTLINSNPEETVASTTATTTTTTTTTTTSKKLRDVVREKFTPHLGNKK